MRNSIFVSKAWRCLYQFFTWNDNVNWHAKCLLCEAYTAVLSLRVWLDCEMIVVIPVFSETENVITFDERITYATESFLIAEKDIE